LGQAGLHLQRLARGEVRRELAPFETAASFQETAELEEAVDLLEPLGFILNRLLDELLERLQARSLATDQVRVDLELEVHLDRQLQGENSSGGDGAIQSLHQRVLKLPVPTQDAKVLLKLLQLDLAAHPPQAPVKKITVEAFPARARPAQAGLFQPLAPEPAKLEITLARLRAAVGEQDDQARQRVGFPMVMDSHRPDSFQVLLLSAEANPSSSKSRSSTHHAMACCLSTPRLVLRWFRPPLAAWVECSPAVVTGRGQPTAIIFNGVKASVVQASGPWLSNGAWWDRAVQWQREEWDVHLSFINCNGAYGLYRILRDLQSDQWFVEGMYD